MKILILFLVLLIPNVAVAHPPYFSQSQPLSFPLSGGLSIKLLHGDGLIIAADPARAVVVDAVGNVHAVSMMSQSQALSIHCSGSNDSKTCAVYDQLSGIVSEVNLKELEKGQIIESNGLPTLYPEELDFEWGFVEHQASWIEIVKFELLTIFVWPRSSFFAIAWWMGIWCLAARSFWKWKRRNWKLTPVKEALYLDTIFSMAVFVGLILITVVFHAFEPASPYFRLAACALGCFLGFLIMRPRVTT